MRRARAVDGRGAEGGGRGAQSSYDRRQHKMAEGGAGAGANAGGSDASTPSASSAGVPPVSGPSMRLTVKTLKEKHVLEIENDADVRRVSVLLSPRVPDAFPYKQCLFAAERAGADQVRGRAGPAVPHIRRQDPERRRVAGGAEHQGRLHGASGDQDAAAAGARRGPAPSAG